MRKLSIAALWVFFLSSCLFAKEVKEEAEQPRLAIAVPWSGKELGQFLPVLRAFEAKEKVKVKALTYRSEDLVSILPAQFEARQVLADVIFMWAWWVRKNPQYAADLRDVWSAEQAAFILPPVEADGKVVAVPYVMAAKPGFWYRKSFFRNNGLSVPKSWDEFTYLLRKIGSIPGVKNPIATGDGVGWPIGDVTEHFIISFGGPELQRNLINRKVSWTSPMVRRVFNGFLVPLLKAGAFGEPIEWTQAVELWWGGDYGLYFMGNWITGMVADATDLGVFPLPGARGLVTGPDFAFIPRNSENQALTKKLLAFMLSKEGQTLRAKQGGKLVVRKDVPASDYPAADQAVATVVASMQTTVDDLDDSIGGDWQRLFWDQLKLLWVKPDSLNDVLGKLQANLP